MSDSRHSGLLGFKWLGRLSALTMFLLVASIALGEGVLGGSFPKPWKEPRSVNVGLCGLFLVTTLLLVGFRWEMLAGIAILAVLIVMNAAQWVAVGHLLAGAFPYFAVPALLYLLHAGLARYWKGTPAA